MESIETEKQIEQFLKQIIDREGINYLSTDSYKVYKELSGTVDGCSARLILVTLLAGVAKCDIHEETALSKYIQKECCLKKSASDRLACLYLSLFSAENCREWNHKIDEGFNNFCKKEWHFDLEAHGVWYTGNVHVDADCYASVDLKVCDSNATRMEVKTLLEQNPFTTEDTLYSYFDEKLDEELSADFEGYVTGEDYYPPVAEDYGINFEYLMLEFCRRYGFELLSYDCGGETSDYIPN